MHYKASSPNVPNPTAVYLSQLLVCGWLLLPALAHAQARTPVMVKASRSGTRSSHAPVTAPMAESAVAHLAQPVAPQPTTTSVVREVDARILPLFGERSKSAQQIEDEIRFLNECDQNFNSREEASQFFAARGWEYISETQLDTAAYRFNLAHLLNDKNGDAFWGLGVICYQRNQLSDAVRMLKMGVALTDTNAVLLTDLATVELEYYQAKQDTASLADAREHLQKAVFLNPTQASAFARLSQISYHQADYRSAWSYLHKAYKLDLATIDLAYIRELLLKEPDPTGLFK